MSPCCGPLASQSWSSLRLSYSFCLVGSGLAAQVGFGASPPDDRHYLNMRAWMWGRVKDWLKFGSIAKDEALETDLTGPDTTTIRPTGWCSKAKTRWSAAGWHRLTTRTLSP